MASHVISAFKGKHFSMMGKTFVDNTYVLIVDGAEEAYLRC